MNTTTKSVVAVVIFVMGYFIYTAGSDQQQSNRAQFVSFECLSTAQSLPQDQRDTYLKVCIAKKLAE